MPVQHYSAPYLEVVFSVAVGVFGSMEEDEQVLAQVEGHGLEAW